MENLENFGKDDELPSMVSKEKPKDEELKHNKIIENIPDFRSDGTELEHPYSNQDGPRSEEFSSRDYYKEILKGKNK